MFLLFPLGHERMEARRWPLVTLVMIALCALALGFQLFREDTLESELRRLQTRSVELFIAYPKLRPPPESGFQQSLPPEMGAVLGKLGQEAKPEAEEAVPPEIEAELATLGQRMRALQSELPARRFGFWRGGPIWGVVSYAFLHAGVLHLLGNAWFLWLSGASLEDRWGRKVYTGFYLLAAVVAALVHRALTNAPDLPLIGASGAGAGAMGAFMVIHGTAKIRFAYALWISFKPRWGTFEASALSMLLLWLVVEVFWGLIDMDSTAHWAHVGGFAFGAGVAFALKRSGWDHRLDAAVEAETSSWQDPRVLEAAKLGADRRYDDAFALLDRAERELPQSIDVQLEMLRLAQEAPHAEREKAAYQKLVANYQHAGLHDTAAALLSEIRVRQLEFGLDRAARFRFADTFARSGQRDAAALLYAALVEQQPADELTARAAVAAATLAVRSGQSARAREYLELAATSPHRTKELVERIEAQLAALERNPTEVSR